MKTLGIPLILAVVGAACGEVADDHELDPGGDSPDVTVSGEEDLQPIPAEMRFKATVDGFAATGPGHDARFDKGYLWVGGHHDAMRPDPLGLVTDDVSIGGMRLSNEIESVRVDERGRLQAARAGFVERFANGYFGVEQSWQLPAKPSREGDLVVRVSVAGYGFAGAGSQGLHFTAPGGFGATYSHALWVDASGIETSIQSKFEHGQIVLRVPASVIASSSFPAVLDPLIDVTETPADAAVDNSPTGADAINPAVASSGTDFLAVWRDERAGDSDIYGMVITSAGAASTTNSVLIGKTAGGARAPGIQAFPAVAFVNGDYLVVWQDFKSPSADSDLVAARVSPAGVVTLIGPIASTAGAETNPRIAVRGNEALVVYEVGGGVAATRYDGTNFVGGTISVAAVGSQPSAAANPAGDYLVAYTDAAATNLQGQFVGATGTLNGGALSLAAGLGAQELSSTAFASGNFIVVWQNNRNGRKIFGARYTTAGTTTDTHLEGAVTANGVQLGTSATVNQGSVPDLACGATNCTIAWMDRRNLATAGHDVFAIQFNHSTLNPGAEFALSNETGDQKQPAIAIASSNERALVIWEDLRNGSPTQITGTRVDSTTVLDGAAARIIASLGVNSQTNSAVARLPGVGGQWLAAWSDSRGTTGGNILGVRASDALALTALTPISIAADNQGTPAIAVTATQHLVAWTDSRNPTKDIFASRVASDGTVLDPAGLPISTFANDQARPAIASNGTDSYLVVWQDRGHAADFEIYGALVSTATGAVTVAEIPVAQSPGDQTAPAVAFDSVANQYVVVWQDSRNGANARDIFGARVSATGVVLDPSGVVISSAAGSQLTPKIAFGTDRSLVVWEDRRPGSGPGANVFGARLQIPGGSSLQSLDPAGIPIAIANGNQQRAAVSFVTTNEFTPPNSTGVFVVAWDDDRNFALTNFDVFGTTVVQSSGVVQSEFSIATSAEPESIPQIGAGGPPQQDSTVRMLVTYQRQHSTLDAQRVVMRRVTFGQGVVGSQHISDALHPPSANPKFFWLPSMAEAFTPTGTFDPTLRPRLKIRIDNLSACDDNATVGTTAVTITNVQLAAPIETYRVTFKPGTTPGLVTGNCYRVVPTLDDVPLGFRDTHVTAGNAATGFKKWGPTTNQTVAFRIEQ